MSAVQAMANLAQFDSPAFELEPIDFESQEVTEIEDLFSFEMETTEPIPEASQQSVEAPKTRLSSAFGFLFRIC